MDCPRSIVRVLGALILLGLVPVQGGCWISLGASAGRVASVDGPAIGEIDWPERDTSAVFEIADRTPAEIFEWRVVDDTVADAEAVRAAGQPRYRVLGSVRTEHGLLRAFDERFEDETDRLFAGLFEGFAANARFLSSQTLASADEVDDWVTSRQRATLVLVGPGMEPIRDVYTLQLPNGTDIFLPDPAAKPEPRGIAVHLRGLISTSYEEAFVDQIVDSDWLVVRIGTRTSVTTPRDDRRARRQGEQIALRVRLINEYQEAFRDEDPRSRSAMPNLRELNDRVERELPQLPRGFDLLEGDDAESVGRSIARTVDDTFAENAYAAEAALRYLIETQPDLAGLPIAVVGCSAGAISAPAVAARLHDRFGDRLSAIVMIGGGADLMRIDRGTALSVGNRLGIYTEGDTPVSDGEWAKIHSAYLESVQLDPIKLGPRLRHVPTLIIRAGFDKWVPASTGSELVRAFGRPDRDWHPGGHQTLFYFLAGRAPRVLRWLDRNTPEPALEAGRASTVAP